MAGGPLEVVVVGGGIAGAACAWTLTRAGRRVLLIEREPGFGHHATGRSAAVLSETSGPAPVRSLALASRSFLERPPPGFADHELTGPRGLLWVADRAGAPALHRFAAEAARQVPSVAVLDPAGAVDRFPPLRPRWVAAALWEPHARSIDVDGLLQGYLRGLRASGGEARTGEGLVTARRRGDRWLVRTDQRSLEAGDLVDAAGAWADDVAQRCGVAPLGLTAHKRSAFVFPPPVGAEVARWPLVMDHGGRFYVEPEAGLLLASPADETPVPPHDARADEADIARAVDALATATTLAVRGVRRTWAGLRTFAPDRVPVIGRDPGEPSFWWAAGLGGYGIKTAPAVAALLACALTGTPLPPTLRAAGVEAAHHDPARLR